MQTFREWLREADLNEAKLREYVVTVKHTQSGSSKDILGRFMLADFLKLSDKPYKATEGYSLEMYRELMKLDVKITGLTKEKTVAFKNQPNFKRTIEDYVAVPGKEYKIKVDGDKVDELISKWQKK